MNLCTLKSHKCSNHSLRCPHFLVEIDKDTSEALEKINFSPKKILLMVFISTYQRKDNIQVDIDFNFDQNKASSPGENPAEHDYRIKSIQTSNFRGIPDQIDGVPFGIDFCIEDVPRSTIILGTNGSGKTSIFSGMEMIYTQKNQ